MNDEFVELVKKSMFNKHLYDGLESASIRLKGNIFHGHILRFKGGDNYLFISNTENARFFIVVILYLVVMFLETNAFG